MGAMRAGKVFTAAVRLSVLLQLGGAHECTVTQADGHTTYDIRNLSDFMDPRASKCTFTWSNASDTVVGTHKNTMEPVISSSFGKLVSSKCIGNMTFSGACELEGTARDYTASCSTSCAAGALMEDRGNFWICFLLLAFVLLFLCCCRKCQTWRKCCCSQTGGFYTAVKFQKGLQAADVERGTGAA